MEDQKKKKTNLRSVSHANGWETRSESSGPVKEPAMDLLLLEGAFAQAEERLPLQSLMDLAVQMKGKWPSGLRATFWISHGCPRM